MSQHYKINRYDGEHPDIYMHIAPFAMNPKIIREFDGYPIVTSKNYVWFVVFENGETIAFASLKVFKNKVKFVNSYVTESYRKKGIHATLISERIKWCNENGIKIIEVDCLDSSLQQYLNIGFKEVKTFVKWHKLYKEL
jgi:predicted GNAT family acetyltransferase